MNKKRVKPYIFQLVKKNILYITTNIILIILIGVALKMSLDRNSSMKKKNSSLTKEVQELQTKYDLLNYKVPSSEVLEENIHFLNSLIPNSEDYFSIIYSLDKLSQKTGFIVTSYSVDMSKSTATKLKLSITGSGDTTSFMSFLEKYNYFGDRLITSDKIELSPQISGEIKIDLTFYNKNIALDYGKKFDVNEKMIGEITKLKEKVEYSYKTSGVEEPDTAYPRKSNPF
ncbi:MAG: hypothetical protein UR89_C0013G0020 [Candidatus Roizmanbacteria bacterium GW2011_GWA2_35_8]|uniref:Fimbrial assembly family protein n=1 Tax=Candidatus Roizmanbacteria bacterium GW2011_GWA2_35_8 TaxID=1618479 RepID=A0A0G0G502_9BACT|nr:MAG: hypothetical protein UR89_C0013G0020 [Candidatus Roizmanbacteria bacterium GW2011_GWA2_35_8]